MRIGIVAPDFPPTIGGMENYAYEIALELMGRGHKVLVLTLSGKGGNFVKNIQVIAELLGSYRKDKKVIQRYEGSVDIWHVMNAAYSWVALNDRPVVISVFGNDFMVPNPVVRLDLKERLRLPFGSRLDFMIACWLTRWMMIKTLPLVKKIVTISEYSEKAFIKKYPKCIGMTTVAYVGLRRSFMNKHIQEKNKKTPTQILTVCRLSEKRKNVDVILKALATIKDQFDFNYRIAGGGYFEQSLKDMSDELGLAGRVQFLGQVSEAELENLYTSSDLFILTSSANRTSVEGFGIVYLEAGAFGMPILACRQGGVAEVVVPNVTGVLVDCPDVASVVGALIKILSGNISFDANACKNHAMGFTWEKVVDRIMPYYAECIVSDTGL